MKLSSWESLLGVPFVWGGRDREKGLDCLGLAIEFYEGIGLRGIVPDPRRGYQLLKSGKDVIGPGLKDNGWKPVPKGDLHPGQAVILEVHGTGHADHIAVYLGEGRILHAVQPGGVMVTRLQDTLDRGARYLGSFAPPSPVPSLRERPPALAAPSPSPQECTGVRLLLIPDPLMDPTTRDSIEVPVAEGTTVGSLVPIQWRKRLRRQVVALDPKGNVLDESSEVRPNQVVVMILAPGGITIGSLLLGILFSAVSFVIQLALTPSLDKPEEVDEQSSPTFRLDGIRNTALPGVPIPVVYGQHIVAGNIISVFFSADAEGRQILNMLIALSQGAIIDIAGLEGERDGITGSAIPSDIKINGTPASEFKNVRVSTRLGTEAQTPIPGFSQSVTAVPFEITLGLNEPFTHTTSKVVDGIQALISFPSGLFRLSNSGNANSYSVDITYRWRALGQAVWNSQTETYSESKRVAFTRQFTLSGLDSDTYEFQVERTAGEWPPSSSRISSLSDLVAINEITDAALSYPGVALLGVQAMSDEQLPGGSPPTVTSVIRGRAVYASDATGFMFRGVVNDDSYRVPAWVVLDLLINPQYGLAVNGNLSIDNIDLESFYEWSQLTQTLVDSGQGNMIRRAVCNTVLDTPKSGWRTIVSIAQSHYANISVVGNKIRAIPMKARNPVALFNMANVSDFSLKYTSRRSRPNVVESEYRNEQTDFELDTAQKVDEGIFDGDPIVKEALSLIGVTHPGQAYRTVQFRLNHANLVGKTAQFKAGSEAIHLIPGDVIKISHDAIAWGTSGRARSSTVNTIILNRDVVVSSGDKIIVRTDGTGADVLQIRTVLTLGSVPAGDALTVDSDWEIGDTPDADDPFSLGATDTYTHDYQIDSIETREDMQRTITAKEYHVEVFDDDPGVVERFTEEFPDIRQIPNPVRTIGLAEQALGVHDGGNVPAIEVSVEKVSLSAAVDIYWKILDTVDSETSDLSLSWQYVGRTFGDRISFLGPGVGAQVVVSAVAVSPEGVGGAADTGIRAEIVLVGKIELPTSAHDMTGFCVFQSSDELILVAPDHPDRDVSEYTVFWSSTPDSIAGATAIADIPSGGKTSIPWRDYATGKYFLFSPRNRTGKLGRPYVWALNLTVGVGLRLDFSHDEHSGWAGVKSDTVVDGGILKLDPGVATGYYESNGVPFSDGLPHRTASLIKDFIRLEEEPLIWNVSGFAWDDVRYEDMTWDDANQLGYENDTPLTWDGADTPWESELSQVITWDGPIDLIEATTPVVEIDHYDGSSWEGWTKSEPMDVEGVEQIAARITLKAATTGVFWRSEAFGLTLLGMVRDAGKYEVRDPNGDYGDGTLPLTIESGFTQVGLVSRDRYRRWPNIPISAPHWVGSGPTGVTPVGNHTGFSIELRAGQTDTIFVDADTPSWAEDFDANDFLNVEITWVGDVSGGGTAYNILLLTGYRPWAKNAGPVSFNPLTAFDLQVIALPSTYVAGQYFTTTLRVRKAFFPGAASLDGELSPAQVITTGLGRVAPHPFDTYNAAGGNVFVISIAVKSGHKIS